MTHNQKLATVNVIQALQDTRRLVGILLKTGVPLDPVMCQIIKDNLNYENHLKSQIKETIQ